MQECFAPDGVHSEDAPSALMKCPARAGRENKREKKRQRQQKSRRALPSPAREGKAYAPRSLGRHERFNKL